MAESQGAPSMTGSGMVLTFATAIVATLLALYHASALLPPSSWVRATTNPSTADPAQLLFYHSFLPRIVMSIITGAALSLAGVIFQQVLRNPLAEPTTLAVSAGAQLALSITMLWMPSLLAFAQSWVAFVGSGAALVVVLLLASASGLSPTNVIVAGLIVSLTCGSASAVLIVLNHEYLSSLFLWQSGSMVQNGWLPTRDLLLQTTGLALLCALMTRPLQVMGLEDQSAASLGVPVNWIRGAMLAVAAALSACVVNKIGVIGFVGLAGPGIARELGARTLRQRLVWAPLIGACLLMLTDQIVQSLTFLPQEIPTGAATGLLGAPLLIWLISRVKMQSAPLRTEVSTPVRRTAFGARCLVAAGSGALATALIWALAMSRTQDGWHLTSWAEFELLSPWRTPRVLAALACGAMLAAAGVIVQRMTGNPMASPEVLGISSGATVAVIIGMFFFPGFDPAWTFPAACTGAASTLVVLLWIAGRSSFSPDRLLLVGVALSSCMTAISSIALASGDPRTSLLITWMSGSTYGVSASQAGSVCVAAVTTLAVASFAKRWLAILPLGAVGAQAVGVNIAGARLMLLLLTAMAVSAPTLIVGPLSFVGLMAPHMAWMLGLQRPIAHLLGAAILGALIMVVADWLGRNILFPWQVPAGLLATLIGAPYLLWLMRRRQI